MPILSRHPEIWGFGLLFWLYWGGRPGIGPKWAKRVQNTTKAGILAIVWGQKSPSSGYSGWSGAYSIETPCIYGWYERQRELWTSNQVNPRTLNVDSKSHALAVSTTFPSWTFSCVLVFSLSCYNTHFTLCTLADRRQEQNLHLSAQVGSQSHMKAWFGFSLYAGSEQAGEGEAKGMAIKLRPSR